MDTSDDFLPTIRSVWRRTVGQSETDPVTQYIFESVAIDLSTSGLPESLDATLDRFEETVSSSQAVDADDSREFCKALFAALQEDTAEDEDGLLPGECEMCERYMPLTRHHLRPRMMHARLKKQGFTQEILSQTANLCALCHRAVHRTFTEKELAMEHNTIEKLMQVCSDLRMCVNVFVE